MQFSDDYIAARYLMFLRAPAKAAPDVDGQYWLGEIGEAREKTWDRVTPYSLARPEPCEHTQDLCFCGEPDCVGHEVIAGLIQEPGFTSRAVMEHSPHPIWQFNCPKDQAIVTGLSSAELAEHQGPILARWLDILLHDAGARL